LKNGGFYFANIDKKGLLNFYSEVVAHAGDRPESQSVENLGDDTRRGEAFEEKARLLLKGGERAPSRRNCYLEDCGSEKKWQLGKH